MKKPEWRERLQAMFEREQFDDRAQAYITRLITDLHEHPEKIDPDEIATAMVWRYPYIGKGRWEGTRFIEDGSEYKRDSYHLVSERIPTADGSFLVKDNNVGIKVVYDPNLPVADLVNLPESEIRSADDLAAAAARASAYVNRPIGATPHALEEFPWALRGCPAPARSTEPPRTATETNSQNANPSANLG